MYGIVAKFNIIKTFIVFTLKVRSSIDFELTFVEDMSPTS